MNPYKVTPVFHPNPIEVSVPGSKSITNRALLLAALSNGESLIEGILFSDDSRHFLTCLSDLGFPVVQNEAEKWAKITGYGGLIPKKEASIYVGSAGTAARFLTAMLAFSDGIYHLDASEQMRRRPMKPLLDSLISIGVRVNYDMQKGHFPFTICGIGNTTASSPKKTITVDIENSSQFLSALLMSAPMLKNGLLIRLAGETHALSYVTITIRMMEQFGVPVRQISKTCYEISNAQHYHAMRYPVEPDVSAACYFYAMAPLLGTSALVRGIHKTSMQGDLRFLSILEEMGCQAEEQEPGILLLPPKNHIIHGITVDMSDCSDQTMTLAAISPFADQCVKILGISHIRLQECDRIHAILTELNRLGISCREEDSGIVIEPGTPHPAVIETYEDHRIAMAFALIGLRIEGISIQNPSCCRKTFENYFEILESIGKRNRNKLAAPNALKEV